MCIRDSHLDVFRPALNPVLTGRSRPDLIGLERGSSRWHAFECKGRISPPDATTETKAKSQAQRLVSVNGTGCTLHVGAITYLRADTLHFYWRDPSPQNTKGTEVPMRGEAWLHYYQPVLEAIRISDRGVLPWDQDTLVSIEGADVKLGIHPEVAKYLVNRQSERAQKAASEASARLAEEGYQRRSQGDRRRVLGETLC
jgi:hypothetical protein